MDFYKQYIQTAVLYLYLEIYIYRDRGYLGLAEETVRQGLLHRVRAGGTLPVQPKQAAVMQYGTLYSLRYQTWPVNVPPIR